MCAWGLSGAFPREEQNARTSIPAQFGPVHRKINFYSRFWISSWIILHAA